LAKGVGGLTEGRTQYRVCGLFIEEKISADGKASENQATSGFAGIKAPKPTTFRQRLVIKGGDKAAPGFLALNGRKSQCCFGVEASSFPLTRAAAGA
jgi:hypothetical protein